MPEFLADFRTFFLKHAFHACHALTSIDLPAGLLKIRDAAFFRCSALQRVGFGRSLSEIGRRAFSGCTTLRNVVIPDSVTRIGENAFERAGVHSAGIDASVRRP
jgi:hypothetical protein